MKVKDSYALLGQLIELEDNFKGEGRMAEAILIGEVARLQRERMAAEDHYKQLREEWKDLGGRE